MKNPCCSSKRGSPLNAFENLYVQIPMLSNAPAAMAKTAYGDDSDSLLNGLCSDSYVSKGVTTLSGMGRLAFADFNVRG